MQNCKIKRIDKLLKDHSLNVIVEEEADKSKDKDQQDRHEEKKCIEMKLQTKEQIKKDNRLFGQKQQSNMEKQEEVGEDNAMMDEFHTVCGYLGEEQYL